MISFRKWGTAFWIPAILSAACQDSGKGFKPFSYQGDFQECFGGWSDTYSGNAETGDDANAGFPDDLGIRACDAETGSEWNLWGHAVTGEMGEARKRLKPITSHSNSYWYAWNTVWPVAEVWGRDKERLKEGDFEPFPDEEFGTTVTYWTGKIRQLEDGTFKDERVLQDPNDLESDPLHPIYLACFEERDCIPSLRTEDESESLWVACRPRSIEDRLCIDDDNKFDTSPVCCEKGVGEPSDAPCCDAVDFAPHPKLSGTPTADQVEAERRRRETDMFRVRGWYLRPEDEVIGIMVDGVPRAYPLKMLRWHEIINDVSPQGRRFAVTYSLLTDSIAIIDGFQSSDTALSFGHTGFVLNGNQILFDRLTDSWWSQLRFQIIRPRGIIGSDPRFSGPVPGCPFPYMRTTWSNWKTTFTDRIADENQAMYVLSSDTGFKRDYTRDPFSVDDPFFKDFKTKESHTFRITNPLPDHFSDDPTSAEYVKNKADRVLGIVMGAGLGGQKGYLFRDVTSTVESIRPKVVGKGPLQTFLDALKIAEGEEGAAVRRDLETFLAGIGHALVEVGGSLVIRDAAGVDADLDALAKSVDSDSGQRDSLEQIAKKMGKTILENAPEGRGEGDIKDEDSHISFRVGSNFAVIRDNVGDVPLVIFWDLSRNLIRVYERTVNGVALNFAAAPPQSPPTNPSTPCLPPQN